MKHLTILMLVVLYTLFSQADTSCHWKKVRGSYWVQYDSSLVNPQSIQECFNSIKKPVVLLEPFEDGNEFQGTVFISAVQNSEILSACETETVQGLNPNDAFDRDRLQNFIDDVIASGDTSGDTTTNSAKWQNYFNSKINLTCP